MAGVGQVILRVGQVILRVGQVILRVGQVILSPVIRNRYHYLFPVVNGIIN
jgi:hypothetical protein